MKLHIFLCLMLLSTPVMAENWHLVMETENGDRVLADQDSFTMNKTLFSKDVLVSFNVMSFDTKQRIQVAIYAKKCLSNGEGVVLYTPIDDKGKLGQTQEAYWDWDSKRTYDILARTLCWSAEVALSGKMQNWDRPNGSITLPIEQSAK